MKKREREKIVRDLVTETGGGGGGGGGLIGVIKAEDRRTHTHAEHGLTNHSVPHHFVFAMCIS